MAEPIRVLLVEDDEDDFLITRDLLREVPGTSYQLMWNSTFNSGLEALVVGKPDVVLVDYHLGQYTGVEFLAEARQKGFNQPIIMLTGEGDGEIDQQAMAAGAADYLVKGQITGPMLDRSIRYSMEQSRTLAKLQEAEEQYRTIFEGVAEGIIRMRLDGWLLLANPELARIFGYASAADLLASNHLNPELRSKMYVEPDRWQKLQRELKRKGSIANFESEIVTPTGRRWIVEQLKLVKNKDGHILFADGTVQDITTRKQAEADYAKLVRSEVARQEIERSLQRFAFLDKAGQQLSATLDYEQTLAKIPRLAVPVLADWCVVHIVTDQGGLRRLPAGFLSNSLERTAAQLEEEDAQKLPETSLPKHGFISEAIKTKKSKLTVKVSADWFDSAAHSTQHRDLLKKLGITSHMVVPLLAGRSCIGAISFVRLAGSSPYTPLDLALAEEFARRVAQEAERARLYSLAQWEIAERKKVQQQLQRSEERFRALIEHSSDVVVLIDRQAKVMYASPSVENVLGYRPDEVTGLPLLQFIHPDDVSRLRQSFKQVMEHQGKTIRSEYRAKHKDGRWRWLEGVGNNLLDTPSVKAVVANFHDVTERVNLEHQKDEFLGIASHELKTPVTSLKAFTQILQRRFPHGDTQAQDYLAKMDNQMNRLTRLINELLDVTRIQAGRLELRIEPLALDQLLQEIVEDFARIEEESRFELEIRQPVTIQADRERIRQAVQNLISNALKYSNADQQVKVRLRKDKNHAVISVQDFGVGIKAEDQVKIFERFYRSIESGQSVGGLGLGLYISSEIAHRHNGDLSVTSRVGEGSTFRLSLPMLIR